MSDAGVVPTRPDQTLEGEGWEKDTNHYPEPVTPFGWSLHHPAVRAASSRMVESDGLLLDGLEMVCIGGEVFVRPEIVGAKPGDAGPPPPAIVMGILVRLHPEMRRRMRTARRVVRTDEFSRRIELWRDEWRPDLERRASALLAEDVPSMETSAFVAHLDRADELLRDGMVAHFQLMHPCSDALHQLARAADELLGWDVATTVAQLTGTSPASTRPTAELAELATELENRPDLRDALDARPHDPLGAVEGLDEGFADRLRRWFDTHGWRVPTDDPGRPALREQPAVVTHALLDAPARVVAPEPVEGPDLPALDAGDRHRFDTVLARAREVYGVREENVPHTYEIPYGILRRWLVDAGRRLVQAGALDDANDAAYCTADELRLAVCDGGSGELRRRAARRRAEEAWVVAYPGPQFVGTEHPPPDLRHLPREGRRVNEASLFGLATEFAGDATASDGRLTGSSGAPGTHRGPVRLVAGFDDFDRVQPGDVVVCVGTTPAWTILFSIAGAVVTDGGGVLSHCSIVAREHGIPAVVGIGTGTTTWTDGQIVDVDGTAGTVTVVD